MTEPEAAITAIDKRIVTFLQSQTVLTLAVSKDSSPYCATCFYAYSPEHNALIFKSSGETRHVVIGLENHSVAGSVLPDKLITGKVKGIQFSGLFEKPEGTVLSDLQKVYYRKYPFAMAMSGDLWIVRLGWVKFTDNTLGFGTKLTWSANMPDLK